MTTTMAMMMMRLSVWNDHWQEQNVIKLPIIPDCRDHEIPSFIQYSRFASVSYITPSTHRRTSVSSGSSTRYNKNLIVNKNREKKLTMYRHGWSVLVLIVTIVTIAMAAALPQQKSRRPVPIFRVSFCKC